MSKLTSVPGSTIVKVPAGRYYVGDLCYVIKANDLWNKVVDAMFPNGQNECVDGLLEVEGHQMVSYSTMYGDGTYYGNGHRFPVDAGLIGLISLDTLEAMGHELDIKHLLDHGTVRHFVEDFECSSENGTLQFGSLFIDTCGHDYDEDEENDHPWDWDDEAED